MNYEFKMPEILPYHAQWDVTSGCNFKCVFCLTSSGQRAPNELSTEEAKALIDKLYDQGIWFLKIMGGEPFFRKDILTLFEYAAKKRMILSFSTNGSLINEEIASNLFELRNSILYIQMSLYGENSERYRKVTGSERNFERALNGLRLLVEKGLDVTILTVATDDNAHSIPEYYNIAKEFGVKEFRLTTEICLGRSAEKVDHEIPKTPKIWSTLIASINTIKNSMAPKDPPVFLDARPIVGDFLFKKTGVPSFYENCSAATTMIYIDPTGNVLPCPFLRQMPPTLAKLYNHIEAKNIKERTFQEVWESESFNIMRSYYDPKNNLFVINDKCKYFRDGTCIPCATTPCNCMDLINVVKKESDVKEVDINETDVKELMHFKSC